MKKRSKRGLASWLTTSTTPIFLLDDRLVVLVFNHGCEVLTGWEASDVIGQKCQFTSHGASDKLETLLGAFCPPPSLSTRASAIESRTIHHLDGTTSEKSISFFPLREEDSDPLRMLGIIGDLDTNQAETIDRPSSSHFELSKIQTNLYRRFGFDSIVARGPEMARVAAQIQIASGCNASVLLTGEPGTGKAHTARAIHTLSPDDTRQFIEIDCTKTTRFEINRTLRRLDSHEQPLTVLLRRIEGMPRDLQERALVLTTANGHLRWMATSQQSPEHLLAMDFNPVLLCGLSSIRIHVPPLRERREDILLLAQFLGEELNSGRMAIFERLSLEVEEEFLEYSWPGNVQELVKTLDEAIRKASDPEIQIADLPVDFRIGRDNQQRRPIRKSLPLGQYLQDVERSRIEEVLLETSGNRTAAAEILGIPRAKLYRRLESLGLDESDEVIDSPDKRLD